LLLVILAATACSKSPPKQAGDAASVASVAVEQGNSGKAASPAEVVPKDLVPVAIAAAQNDCTHGFVMGLGKVSFECEDFHIQPDAKAQAVTAADQANGIGAKWCLTVTALRKRSAGPWEDFSASGVYSKRGAAWEYKSISAFDKYEMQAYGTCSA
jgi:hypothetical protein